MGILNAILERTMTKTSESALAKSLLSAAMRYCTGQGIHATPLPGLTVVSRDRLLSIETTDAASVAFQVGYESPSQFSREYRRLFGQPPMRHVELLREASVKRPDGKSGEFALKRMPV
jgi:AraC-like DNA-binding protein